MRAKTRLLSSGGLVAALSISLPLTVPGHSSRAAASRTGASVAPAAEEERLSLVKSRFAPRPAAPVPPPVPPVPTVLTVAAGDSLSVLAARVGRTWQQLAGWNRLSWAQAQAVVVGQVLKIPAAGYVPPALVPPAPPASVLAAAYGPATPVPSAPVGSFAAGSGVYSYAALESLWVAAGGPSWAAPHAAEIAMCESGGKPWAYNPSGATGLWQILGSVVPGNLYDPMVNAENAVAKFHGSGNTFSPWVCT